MFQTKPIRKFKVLLRQTKKELIEQARANDLPVDGSKRDLAERIVKAPKVRPAGWHIGRKRKARKVKTRWGEK